MRVIGVAELKANLSGQLACVKAGEEVVITERGKPIARLTPMEALDMPERLQALARRGVVRLPRRPPEELPPRVEDPEGRLLAALLAEREEGR